MSMERSPEPELMDLADEVRAYAQADFAAVNQRFVERLCELTGGRLNAAAVDLGCGPGDIAIRAAKAQPMWHITAIDASKPMLDWAANAAQSAGVADRIVWTIGDAKSLPLATGGFDVIFSNSLLHHITDAEAMWREVKRIAKPGAQIFFRDLYRPASQVVARRIVATHAATATKLLQEEFYRSLLSAYSAVEIRSQLAQADLYGFSVNEINDRHIDIIGTG